jgi:putative Holliday junction resolvase
MAIAAIDYGKRRLGIAAADDGGTIVYPAGLIERKSLKLDLARLASRLGELEVTRVIIGLPLNMNGSAGPAARAAEKFAHDLHLATGLPVELHDERLSTFEAEERLRGLSGRRRRTGEVDAVAAVVILESWLSKAGRL